MFTKKAQLESYIDEGIERIYLSEKTENYMDELLKDDGVSYREALKNEELAPIVRDWSIEHLGYIIEPKYLWASLIDEIKGAEFSIEHFDKAISALVASTIGQESEAAFDKLFDDMNLQDKDLGKEVSERTALIAKVMQKVDDISFNVDDAEMDVLGTAYMILISLFASDAGKKGGEFFTPTCASKLLARLATVGLDEVKNAADSCAGSGSLLLEVQNHLSTKKVGHFYATEKNGSNYNLSAIKQLHTGNEAVSGISDYGAFATGLLGKNVMVQATDVNGTTFIDEGTVSSLEIQDGEIRLVINGYAYKPSDVVRVTEAVKAEETQQSGAEYTDEEDIADIEDEELYELFN